MVEVKMTKKTTANTSNKRNTAHQNQVNHIEMKKADMNMFKVQLEKQKQKHHEFTNVMGT